MCEACVKARQQETQRMIDGILLGIKKGIEEYSKQMGFYLNKVSNKIDRLSQTLVEEDDDGKNKKVRQSSQNAYEGTYLQGSGKPSEDSIETPEDGEDLEIYSSHDSHEVKSGVDLLKQARAGKGLSEIGKSIRGLGTGHTPVSDPYADYKKAREIKKSVKDNGAKLLGDVKRTVQNKDKLPQLNEMLSKLNRPSMKLEEQTFEQKALDFIKKNSPRLAKIVEGEQEE